MASALGLAAIAIGAGVGASQAVLVAVSAGAGSTAPPLIATVRATWSDVVSPDELRPAYALTATLGDAAQVVGPAAVAAIAVTLSPAWSLGPCAAAAVIAPLLVAPVSAPAGANGRLGREARRSPLASAGQRILIGADLAVGFALGLLDIGLPAFALREATAPVAGVLLAALGAGSVIGGLWYGRRLSHAPGRQYGLLLGILALALAPIWLASTVWTMALLLVAAGLAIAPANTVLFEALDLVVPKRTAIEAFTWLTTANSAGIALGAAAGGWLIGHVGIALTLALPSASVAVAAAVAWWGRDRLGPRPA